MRLLLQIAAIAVTGFIFSFFMPWYGVAFAAFIWGYVFFSKLNFIGGFLGGFLLWGIKILVITSASSSDLAERVAKIFPVQEGRFLILLTLVLVGLVTGMSAVTGGLLRSSKAWKRMYRR